MPVCTTLKPVWIETTGGRSVYISALHVDVPRRVHLFEVLPSRIELGIVRVIDTPEATHIRYHVRR
jgi:hypothetical protein